MSMLTTLRSSLPLCWLAALLGVVACKREPPLAQRMAGPWRATIEHGARTSSDPLTRGLAKLWNPRAGLLRVSLDVRGGVIEVKRPSAKAQQEVTQRATFVELDRERVALTTERGRLVARVELGCNAEACLEVRFTPEPGADPRATEAMGFLFGCDDLAGEIDCASPRARTFFRFRAGAE